MQGLPEHVNLLIPSVLRTDQMHVSGKPLRREIRELVVLHGVQDWPDESRV